MLMQETKPSLYRVTQFELHFLGMVQEINLSTVHSQNPNVQLIDKVEESQVHFISHGLIA